VVAGRFGNEVVDRLVDPLLGGIHAGRSDRLSLATNAPDVAFAATYGSLAKGLRLTKTEDAEVGYEMMKSLYDKRVYPNVDGVRNVIRLLGKTSELIRRLKPEDLVDDRIVRKLEKEGLF